MSLQHAALEVMDYAARTLDGLAEGDYMADQARFAATRCRAAARSLSIEPLNASRLLELAGLALPDGDLREQCLAAHTTIQTTPMYHPKKRSSGRVSYRDLKAGRAYEIDHPLND